jgi:O-antigen/teichoic acid export membrane protein
MARNLIAEVKPTSAPGEMQRVARGGAFALVGVASSAVLQFALVLVVTHGVPRATAGAFLEAVALFMILSNLTELGADTGVVRMVPRLRATGRDGDLRALVRAAVVPVALAGGAAAVLVLVLAGPASQVLFGSEAQTGKTLLVVLAPALPFACVLTLLLAVTRGFGRMRPFVLITNVWVPGARLIAVAAVIVVIGSDPAALALAWGLPLVVGIAIAASAVRRELQRRPVTMASSGIAGELWRFSIPRALAVGCAVTVNWVDVLLVGAIVGPRGAAVYGAISRLSVIGAYGLQTIGMVVAPRMSALMTVDDMPSLDHLYQAATRWAVIVSWPLYLLMVVFAPLFARIFGEEYTSGATALAVLAAAGLVNLATGNSMVLLLMAGKSSWNLLDSAGSMIVNLALNLLLIPPFGITGAAIAWSVSIVGTNLVSVIQVRRATGLQPFGRSYALACVLPLACFGLLGLIARSLAGWELPVVLVTTLLGTLLYVPLLFRFREPLSLPELAGGLRLRLSPRRARSV